jgi:hypothetical protein
VLLLAELLEQLPAFLYPFVAALHEQQPQQQQQLQSRQQRRQQQRSQQRSQQGVQPPSDNSAGSRSNALLLSPLWFTLGYLLQMWAFLVQQMPTAMPNVARTALPLLQQLQRCGSLLPFAATAGSGGNTASAGSPKTTFLGLAYYSAGNRGLQLALVVAGVAARHQPGSAAHQQAWQLDSAVTQMALQQLIICAALVHREHTEQLQQQQKAEGQQPSRRSSKSRSSSGNRPSSESSNSGDAQQQQSRKMRADLLRIPAYHQDLVPLLPGGQAYLDGMVAAVAAEADSSRKTQLSDHWADISGAVSVLVDVLSTAAQSLPGGHNARGRSPLLSEAALKLVLEVQLLAAGALQRQRIQRSSSDLEGLTGSLTSTLLNGNVLLLRMLQCLVKVSGSGLPPELLQQAGLQLLQALAAPLQQVQLCKPGEALLMQANDRVGALQYQLYALKGAAAGLLVGELGSREGALAALQHHCI